MSKGAFPIMMKVVGWEVSSVYILLNITYWVDFPTSTLIPSKRKDEYLWEYIHTKYRV